MEVPLPDNDAGARVVLRVRFVVSADGGKGREARIEALHRKHSPFPKYEGDGRGYSERYAPNVCMVLSSHGTLLALIVFGILVSLTRH